MAKKPSYKPVQFEPARYPLTGGVDTKIHGFVLPAPKLQACENAHVDQTGSIQRRFGRSALANDVQGGGTAASWAALATYKGNLVGVTAGENQSGGHAYEYSETTDRWVAKGGAESVRVRSTNVAKSGAAAGAFCGDTASANGIRVTAYEEYEPGVGAAIDGAVRITITDAEGVVLKRAHTLASVPGVTAFGLFGVKVVARGNLVYVFWYDEDLLNVRVAIVDATSTATLGTMAPTPVTVTSANVDTTWPFFDVAPNSSSGILICWNDTTANRFSFGFVDATGVLGGTSTHATTAGTLQSLACAVAPGNAMHGMVYTLGTTPTDLYAIHRSWNGSAWTSTATSAVIDTALADPIINLGCRYESLTSLRIVYTEPTAGAPKVHQSSYTTLNAISARIATIRHSRLASKPVLGADGRFYFWVLGNIDAGAEALPLIFLIRDDNVVIAKALDTGAANFMTGQTGLPQIERAGSSLTVAVAYLAGLVKATEQTFAASIAIRLTTVDFAHNDSHANIEWGEGLYMGGGMLLQYDGDSFVESGFLVPFPGADAPTPSTVVGTHLTLLAEYSYLFVYEWTNIRGEREQGTTYGPVVVAALTGTDNKLAFALRTLAHTLKQGSRGDVVIAAYRTLANPNEDSPHFRVGQVANNPSADTVVFEDTLADADAAELEQFYQDAGELENTAPPSGHILASGNGRVLIGGFADAPNDAMASKQRTPGRALEFSDFMPRIVFPGEGGDLTALAFLNETVIGFKAGRLYRVRGDGPNNVGSGEFFPAELISSDTGTSSARSVVVTPMGIMFEGAKGKMLLDQALQLHYIGAPLEKLPDPGVCTGATLIPELQQVRFSYAATTHVFDYYHRQWYVFTHHSDGPTVLWNGVLTALEGDLAVFDDAASWTDAGDAYSVTLTLGWVASSATLHGDMRVKSIALRGESLAAHYLSVIVSYDGAATPSQTIDSTIVAPGILESQWRLVTNIFQMVEVTIRDAVLDVYGADVVQNTAGARLQELVFELGPRSTSLGRKG